MKKIEAIIRPERWGLLKNKLADLGYNGITVYDVKGRGKESGTVELLNGHKVFAELLPKTKVELFVKDENLKAIVDLIKKLCSTDKIGDGKIFISTIDECIRIRDGACGEDSI